MKLAEVLAATKTEKTAAAPAAPAPSAAPSGTPSADALKTALHEVLAAEKTASAPSTPVKDLEKIAGEIASAEEKALLKEASLYGAAAADGFMARLSQYNEAAEKIAAQNGGAAPTADKTASEGGFAKFAAENELLVKQAADVGFREAQHQIGQLKQAAYNKGMDTGVLVIYKVASDTFVRGFEDVGEVLKAARGTA